MKTDILFPTPLGPLVRFRHGGHPSDGPNENTGRVTWTDDWVEVWLTGEAEIGSLAFHGTLAGLAAEVAQNLTPDEIPETTLWLVAAILDLYGQRPAA